VRLYAPYLVAEVTMKGEGVDMQAALSSERGEGLFRVLDWSLRWIWAWRFKSVA
jgi:hypothetical protein